MKSGFLVWGALMLCSVAYAQTSDELLNVLLQKGLITQAEIDSLRAEKTKTEIEPSDKSFTIDLEFRPRAELKNGYRTLRDDSTLAAFFVSQRSRLNITYEQKNKFKFHTSIQDIRVWGQYDPRSTAGTLQVFEAYVEPYLTPKITARIGRQRIMFDNQRLFAQNDWRQNAGSHDGLSFHYTDQKIVTDIAATFNQSSERTFGTDFDPIDFANYKYLVVHHLKYNFNEQWALTTLNVVDGFQDAKRADLIYSRYTNGGRIDYKKKKWLFTFSGYYQWGQNKKAETIDAWYIQPEIQYSIPEKTSVRLGAEVLSGRDGTRASTIDQSFVPLYGVAHRFNGSLDYFTIFPEDLNNAGLINPYLFFIQQLGKKFSIRSDFHLFYTQNKLVQEGRVMNAYLGFENDWLFSYKANEYTLLDLGASYGLFTKSMEAVKGGGNSNLLPTWYYLQIRFTPRLLKL